MRQVVAITSRIKDLRVYEGYTDSYSRNARYIDIPVVGRDPMHDILPMEDPMPRDWPVCSNSVYHYRDQSQSSQLWIPSIPDVTTFYRRGRKKRVPYTKPQLKELEREYTISKFITKDKRRRIAFSTSLSERQVTIWFQNRRVKDKKVISEIKGDETCS
ncbi:homeobox protein Hox-D13a [Osmerus eperlanus]|uniref:homeobox protein Hox-D13a n=1 Tax=Osmerus eperlanus TaxID=29151 RepID=UPI002E0EA5A5